MPVYEYDCLACGARFEVAGSFANGPDRSSCPDCDSVEIRRHYGSVGVITRGRGAPSHGGTSADLPPGLLRPADPERLTRNVAQGYATRTGDKAMSEIVRRIDAGSGPGELRQFVSEVKAERETGRGKRREQK